MKYLRLGIVVGLTALFSPQLFGSVTITEPIGGNNLSADKALDSTNGAAFTALGDIVITETGIADFASGINQTLILTPPAGWRFNAGIGSVLFRGSRNITAASIAVSALNVSVTFSVGGTTKYDVLTISGLQVQPLTGAPVPLAGYILRSSANPGTAVVAGIVNDVTPFALLNTIPGAARALVMQTQPSATAIARAPFDIQPELNVLDQFGNFCEFDTITVVTAARAAGSGTLQGSPKQCAIAGLVSYTNLFHSVTGTITIQFTATNLTSVTSDPVLIIPAPADRLVFTTQPAAATAGAPFAVQPVLRSQDRFGSNSVVGLPASQMVTLALASGTGTLLGTTTFDIGTSAGNGVVTFNNLQINAAGTGKQLLATSAGLISALSSSFIVNPGPFTRLQLLVPGETAAPGTPGGKTGSPTVQPAAAPFNVIVNAVDDYWNLVNTVKHTVGVTSSDPLAVLPANAALAAGTKSFAVTLKTAGSQNITARDISDATKASCMSPPIPVNPGPASRLAIQSQPASVATAGVLFSQQPMIRVEDVAGNLVTADNGRVITVARAAGTGALQGTLAATTANGLATFTDLSHNVAESITLNFTAAGLSNTISGTVGVGPATAVRLAFTAQPGGLSRTGSPLAAQPVITAQDPFANRSTIGLPAGLNVTLALSSGSGSLLGTTTFDIGTAAANGIAICTNLQCSDAGTNKQLTATAAGLTYAVSAWFTVGGVERATGGSAISADTTGGAYTTLTGPTYYEAATANVGKGTIILQAPAGFVFDPSGLPAPTVLITRLAGSGGNANNINRLASGTVAAIRTRTPKQITFVVNYASAGGVTCAVTWQNVRVRPEANTPLASGDITKSGTSRMAAVTSGITSLGTLTEVAGLARSLALVATEPGNGTADIKSQVIASASGLGGAASASYPGSQPPILTGIAVMTGGLKLTFSGAAGFTYRIEQASAPSAPNSSWQPLGSATTDSFGQGEFTAATAPGPQAYFRVTLP